MHHRVGLVVVQQAAAQVASGGRGGRRRGVGGLGRRRTGQAFAELRARCGGSSGGARCGRRRAAGRHRTGFRDEVGEARQRTGLGHADQRDLEHHAAVLEAAQAVAAEDAGGDHRVELVQFGAGGQFGEAVAQGPGGGHQGGVGTVDLQQQDRAQRLDQFAERFAFVDALLLQRTAETQRGAEVAGEQGGGEVGGGVDADAGDDRTVGGEVEAGPEFAGQRQDAFEGGLGVTHAAAHRIGDLGEHVVGDRHAFPFGDAAQAALQVGLADAPEQQHLAARPDRVGDLVQFGGRQHEHHAWRRLLEGLQERVEGALGQHVHLVEDEHLVARAHRREGGVFAQGAHVVDAVVGSGVDLDDVRVAAVEDRAAEVAFAARVGGRAVFAVQAPGQDAGRGGLADPAAAREQERVRDALLGQRHAQRLQDLVLPDHLLERLRPEPPCHDEVRRVRSVLAWASCHAASMLDREVLRKRALRVPGDSATRFVPNRRPGATGPHRQRANGVRRGDRAA